MRIIGGSLKGKTIDYLKNLNTRPLKDSVKENIFNILEHSKKNEVKIINEIKTDSTEIDKSLQFITKYAPMDIYKDDNKENLKGLKLLFEGINFEIYTQLP